MTRDEAIAYYKKLAIRIKGIIADENEAFKDRFSQTLEATEMAIRSLEAWEKVTDEIFELHDNDDAYWNGVSDCWKIIDKHLKGVTECK